MEGLATLWQRGNLLSILGHRGATSRGGCEFEVAAEDSSLTWRFARASHASNIALILLLHLLLDSIWQLIDLLGLVGALKLSVPILPTQVAVLVILQSTCSMPSNWGHTLC